MASLYKYKNQKIFQYIPPDFESLAPKFQQCCINNFPDNILINPIEIYTPDAAFDITIRYDNILHQNVLRYYFKKEISNFQSTPNELGLGIVLKGNAFLNQSNQQYLCLQAAVKCNYGAIGYVDAVCQANSVSNLSYYETNLGASGQHIYGQG